MSDLEKLAELEQIWVAGLIAGTIGLGRRDVFKEFEILAPEAADGATIAARVTIAVFEEDATYDVIVRRTPDSND